MKEGREEEEIAMEEKRGGEEEDEGGDGDGDGDENSTSGGHVNPADMEGT